MIEYACHFNVSSFDLIISIALNLHPTHMTREGRNGESAYLFLLPALRQFWTLYAETCHDHSSWVYKETISFIWFNRYTSILTSLIDVTRVGRNRESIMQNDWGRPLNLESSFFRSDDWVCMLHERESSRFSFGRILIHDRWLGLRSQVLYKWLDKPSWHRNFVFSLRWRSKHATSTWLS